MVLLSSFSFILNIKYILIEILSAKSGDFPNNFFISSLLITLLSNLSNEFVPIFSFINESSFIISSLYL